MKLILVLCAVVAMAFATYGGGPNYHQVGYGHHQNYVDSPFYKEPRHYKRGHGRHGRHHRRSSSDSSDSSSESRSHSREYDYGYDRHHGYPQYPQPVPNYGNIANEAPAATAYGSPSNDVPAPAPYGVNTFGGK